MHPQVTINERFKSLIPKLSTEEFSRLEANIKTDGCRDPLVLWNGTLVDGHNRFQICQANSIPFNVHNLSFPSEQHAELWIRFNQLGRRNLTDDQRAIIADAAAELESKIVRIERAKEAGKQGGRGNIKSLSDAASDKLSKPPKDTRAKAAKAAKVSERKMKKARKVRKASPELAKQVESGELTLAAAERQINEKERKETLKTTEWPTDKFRVIYADPPWQYGDARTGSKESGGVVAQYETMPLDAICGMKVREVSMPDSVLFLWATSPLIPEAIAVINAWGFKYKASFVWDKEQGFNGHYNDVQHELLLVATRGSCIPESDALNKSIVRCRRESHSQKPSLFRQMIDTMYPSGPRIELFARVTADGWKSWGNEV